MARITHKFKNGATLIYNYQENTNESSFVATFKGGSNAEKIGGLAHLCEHLVFLGGKYQEKTSQIIEDKSIWSNAYTYPQKTAFGATATNADFLFVSNLHLDNILKFNFSKDQFEREREIVKIEMQQVEKSYDYDEEYDDDDDDEMEQGEDNDNQSIYPTNEVFAITVDFPKYKLKDGLKFLDTITYKDTQEFAKQNYVASNLVVSVSSNLPFETILKGLQNKIEKFKTGEEYKHQIPKLYEGNQIINIKSKKNFKTAEVNLEFMNRENFYENANLAYVLSTVLNGFRGTLMQELRVKKPCCYGAAYTNSVIAEAIINHKIYLTTNPKNCMFVAKTLLEIVANIKENGITKEQYNFLKKENKKLPKSTLSVDDLIEQTEVYFYEGEQNGYNKDGLLKLSYEELNEKIKQSLNNLAYTLDITCDSSYSKTLSVDKLSNILSNNKEEELQKAFVRRLPSPKELEEQAKYEEEQTK